jgi:hypothetical protein
MKSSPSPIVSTLAIPGHDIFKRTAHKLRLQALNMYHERKKKTKSREFI